MSILDIDIKSSFKFQIIFFLSCAIHVTFLILFTVYEMYVLSAVNVVSVIFYLSAGIASRRKSIESHIKPWILATYIEITAHAVLATLWLGFESCFFLYAIIALVVSSYVVYLSLGKNGFFKVIGPFTLTSFAVLIFCFAFLDVQPPLVVLLFDHSIADKAIEAMRGVNIFLNFAVIFFFTIVFIAEMNSLVGKLEKTNQKLNYIANHDALTDLYNRHSLKELFIRFIEDFRSAEAVGGDENGEQDESCLHYCVIMGDVDNFKRINDTYGHSCGDLVLKGVSAVIKKSVADKEIACRWGGEEFLILMIGNKEECVKRAEEIRQKVSDIRIEEEKELTVTMTFGLVFCTEKRDGAVLSKRITKIDELVQIADSRLYAGKGSGKNVVIYR